MSDGYAPLFSSLTTGTLCGRWPDIGLWPIVLSLADRNGVVDVTPQYISGVTGLALPDVMACMKRFCEPDPYSRSAAEQGSRLTLVSEHRDWGWKVVNHGFYRERARLLAKTQREVDDGTNRRRLMERRFAAVGLTLGPAEHCRYCGDAATGVDHILWDGPDEPWNAVPACQRCNTSKHRRDLLDFLNSCLWIKAEIVMAEPKLEGRLVYRNGVFDRRNGQLTAGNEHGPPSTGRDPLLDQTILNKTKQKIGDRERAMRAPTAKRLPEGFTLTPERRAIATAEKADPEREFARFCDHWRAAAGQNARKHDWDAAWRNWCRKAAEFKPRNSGGEDPPKLTWRPPPDDGPGNVRK